MVIEYWLSNNAGGSVTANGIAGKVTIRQLAIFKNYIKEGANKRGNSSRLTQSFHFFMFEPIFSPVNALNQPI
ncbi:hypothetical protein V9748_22280 [Escherichia coli]|uniref:hypothetical protein n=1 Tax=Escherichia coli TaxID=562 RepID=UPI001BBA6DCA|nr:hypothetical protein [Escherichia coli]MCA7773059.1 hypothetical protein [Escherichia coli]MCA7793095.1 hypothetical protein [Escherichia coli]HBD1388647.1 hypothetical protein [Escherichia coli]HCD2604412.1 hypothetical protein [Escherichia coli]